MILLDVLPGGVEVCEQRTDELLDLALPCAEVHEALAQRLPFGTGLANAGRRDDA